MRCPVCRCEVGNQSVCPFCGATVYTGQNWNNSTTFNRNTIQYEQTRAPRERSQISNRKLRCLEKKMDLLLVFGVGSFLLLLIILVVLILK